MMPSENTHPETTPEYHRRVQDQMDMDSWVGRDDVACHFPEKAIVHEIETPDMDDPPHVYKFPKRY